MDKMLNRIIGKHVKKVLLRRNMSQTQLAKAVQLPLSTVNDYIRGKTRMSYKNMERIATYLNIDIQELFITSFLRRNVMEHGVEYMTMLYKDILLEEGLVTITIGYEDELRYNIVILPKKVYQHDDIVCLYRHVKQTYKVARYKNRLETDRIIGYVVSITIE